MDAETVDDDHYGLVDGWQTESRLLTAKSGEATGQHIGEAEP
jgi:hypothetical protein